MRLGKREAVILLCSAALIGMSGAAVAKPVHKRDRAAATSHTEASYGEADDRYTFMRKDWERTHGKAAQATSHARRSQPRTRTKSRAVAAAPVSTVFGSGGGLVAEARRYLGTNPTGRRNLWCGAFMDMVLKRTGHEGGGNLARAYASYGTRISGPQVGAIAVMRRKGGGHVGVVSGIDPNGNPIIVSGNHNNTVAETVYPRGRIIAYVMPGG